MRIPSVIMAEALPDMTTTNTNRREAFKFIQIEILPF